MASTNKQTSMDEEEESVLPLDEQTMRPLDVAVQQQSIPAWHPILDPEWMICAFFILAVIMIPVGFKLEALSDEVVELKSVYDSVDNFYPDCRIGMTYKANTNCTLEFIAPQDMHPPVLVYYELTNFHQNHRFYSKSRDDYQLAGQVGDQDSTQEIACDPLNKLGNITLNPCGLIANSFFSDKFTLLASDKTVDDEGAQLTMTEDGIAWQSDLEHRFKMPDGFQQELCNDDGTCDDTCCQRKGFSCKSPATSKTDGKCYAYDYPNDDTTQYLHETYPHIVSPLEHVTNEHFVVWMRVATRPQFRKLYGYIEQTIPKGTTFSIEINLNYVVDSFGGSKALIISSNNIVGGKNEYLGPTFYYMGFFCLGCGVIFALKHWFKPRKIANPKYLQYKED